MPQQLKCKLVLLYASLVFAAPHAVAATPFFEGFDVPGDQLDVTRWTTEFGDSSFFGRTQLQDWVNPGAGGKFSVAGGQAQLALETFNPTAKPTELSLYGTHAKTLASFQPDATTGYELTVGMRLKSLQPGIVYGIYFFGCGTPPLSCKDNHDELDIEIVTNFLQPASSPMRVQLNRFDNEALGAGHGPIVDLPDGFDPLAAHDWRIRWMQDRVTYFLDGTELFSATTHVPQGSMQVNINAWGPGPQWPDAYSPLLKVADKIQDNERFVAEVDFVSVSAVPEPAQWAMFLVGAALVGVATRRHTAELALSQ